MHDAFVQLAQSPDKVRLQSKPHYEYTEMQYDPQLPEDFFRFTIPAGAQVVGTRLLRRRIQETPGLGIAVDGLSCEQACRKVAQAYWQAVIDGDRDTANGRTGVVAGSVGPEFYDAD